MNPRLIKSKQMGDACEMLVAAELTLAGVPTMIMPDNWPGYDVIAQLKGVAAPQRISVKSRTFKHGGDAYVEYNIKDESFDWLAVVTLPGKGQDKRQYFIVPRAASDARFHQARLGAKYHNYKSLRVDKMAEVLPEFENNFRLSATGTAGSN
jgi:hypothetical protein